MRKLSASLKQASETTAGVVAYLRDVADKIERGEVALISISAGVEPEYATLGALALGHSMIYKPPPRVVSCTRTLSVTYRGDPPPALTHRMEDFTQG